MKKHFIVTDAGEHSVILNAKGILSGTYICRMFAKCRQVGNINFVVV